MTHHVCVCVHINKMFNTEKERGRKRGKERTHILCYAFTHHTPSHLHTFPPSHHQTFPPSHHHTFPPSHSLLWQVIVLLAVPVMHEATPTPTALGDGGCSIHVLVFHSIVSIHWTGCMRTPETVDLGGEGGRGGEGGEGREGKREKRWGE